MTKSANSQSVAAKETIVVDSSALASSSSSSSADSADQSMPAAAAASSSENDTAASASTSASAASGASNNPAQPPPPPPPQTQQQPLYNLVNETRRLVDCDQFKLETLANLFRFKNENLFTDVSIYVDGIEFPCHKVILCAASSYFKAMFSCDLKESRLGKVYIESISPWTMKRLIDFIYTGKIEINYENVIDVFNAAMMFQLNALVDKCTAYIQDHIDVSNCVEVHIFASIHNLAELERDTFAFIQENFMLLLSNNEAGEPAASEADEEHEESASARAAKQQQQLEKASSGSSSVNMSDFVHLNEATFAALLKSDSLNVSREVYAYYALKKWTEHREHDHDDDDIKAKRGSGQGQQAAATAVGGFKMQAVYEGLFKYIRINSLNKEELEYILNNDEYVKASQTLGSRLRHILQLKTAAAAGDRLDLNKYLAEDGKANAAAAVVSTALPKPLASADVSAKPEDAAAVQRRPAGAQQDLLKRIIMIKNSMERNSRPSTIPREYLCMLHGDTFQLYDFYKSKWETLASWPPLLNRREAASTPTGGAGGLTSNPSSSAALFQLSCHAAAVETSESRARFKLNGFSTCLVNNLLYVSGGYLVDNEPASSSSSSSNLSTPLIELVDGVWRFDPVKSEWTTCRPMLRKRAFHLSISLMSSSSASHAQPAKDFLFLFYGVCYDATTTTTTTAAAAAVSEPEAGNSLVTCLSIEYYDIQADTWSVLNLNKSLLSQHLFQSVHLNSRSYQTQTAAVAAASAALNSNLVHSNNNNNHANDPERPVEEADAIEAAAAAVAAAEEPAAAVDNRLVLLNNLLEQQRNLVRSIVSLRNLIYILKENCIHCYEFSAAQGQLTCLPYFCLPSNLSTFSLATAVPVKTSSSACMSVFTWLSDEEDDDATLDGPDASHFKRQLSRYCRKAAAAAASTDAAAVEPVDEPDSATEDEHAVCKKEALVYLINPQQRSIYEFYPAKNKLKQMPNLLLPHSPKDTFIIDINSKIYATGGIIAPAAAAGVTGSSNSSSFDESPSSTTTTTPTTTANRALGSATTNDEASSSSAAAAAGLVGQPGFAIEEYDKEKRAWSIFMGANWQALSGGGGSGAGTTGAELASSQAETPTTTAAVTLPVLRHFFKLKTSFF